MITAFAVSADAVPAPAVTTPVHKAPAVKAAAPALTAPSAAAPVKTSYGVLGVKAVAKPKPKPKPAPVVTPVAASTSATAMVAARTQTAPASRSTTRTSTPSNSSSNSASSTPSTPTTPQVPANGGVLAIAASLSGIPYVYGGSTPAGFDCSGFTSYIFAKVGISLPRTAAGQQAAATPVSNPQPGDLVFFGYPAYHVGIYAGNGMMYDSPRTGLSSGLRAIWSSSATYGRP